ncbi:MAG: thioredoxin family protein [Siphonobacter sp.]
MYGQFLVVPDRYFYLEKNDLHDLLKEVDQSGQILKIDAASHSEVVNSFGVTRFPTFILIQQGVELWRSEGFLSRECLLTT